eukprot:9478254-Pyramimonas_sp.AAC.1
MPSTYPPLAAPDMVRPAPAWLVPETLNPKMVAPVGGRRLLCSRRLPPADPPPAHFRRPPAGIRNAPQAMPS